MGLARLRYAISLIKHKPYQTIVIIFITKHKKSIQFEYELILVINTRFQ